MKCSLSGCRRGEFRTPWGRNDFTLKVMYVKSLINYNCFNQSDLKVVLVHLSERTRALECFWRREKLVFYGSY